MPAGRPKKINKDKIGKLEEAFAIGCTDLEACLFADIAASTLYDYQKEHTEFLERKKKLKEMPVLKARTKVVEEIDNDPGTAKWYLERKKKDEFGPQQKVDVSGAITIEDAINAIDEE